MHVYPLIRSQTARQIALAALQRQYSHRLPNTVIQGSPGNGGHIDALAGGQIIPTSDRISICAVAAQMICYVILRLHGIHEAHATATGKLL